MSVQIFPPPDAARLAHERAYPQIDPQAREILSLLLVDPGAFSSAEQISRHAQIDVLQVRRALSALVFLGCLTYGWVVTDAGRETLEEVAP